MYKLINAETNEFIGAVQKPTFIRVKEESGAFVPANDVDAQGIAFKSKPYNLLGREGVGADETIALWDIDICDYIQESAEVMGRAICENRAERMYEPGEYMMIDGKLYRVTLQIPARGMIAVGTNVEETDITKEISKLH